MKHLKALVVTLTAGGILGAGISFLFPDGSYWISWLGAAALLSLSLFILFIAWQKFGKGKQLAWLMVSAFFLRIVFGTGLTLALPSLGWDEPAQNAGYLFYDAFQRDNQAWQLAESGDSILNQTREELYTDQYGGMLTISALLYRVLSPDVHRSYLVLLFGAFAFTLGIPFFYRATANRWDTRLAGMAAWFLVLYPDGLLYTSSQMREPFILGLSMIAFWAVMRLPSRKPQGWIVLVLIIALMTMISSRIAAAVFFFLLMLFLLENLPGLPAKVRKFTWVILLVLVLLFLAASWAWLQSSAEWDMILTERGSGWVAKVIEEIGAQYRIPFLVIYGIAQPVLPAAIAEPTLPLWKVINIARAAGWYMLAPLLVYAIFTLFKVKDKKERQVWAWMAAFSILWIIIASARAGGDQWDNPRYRANMLPWLVLTASWAIRQAIVRRDAWLPRLLLVEAVFLGFFTNWYFSRYFLLWRRMLFWEMVTWITGLSALILLGGLGYDRWKKQRLKAKGNSNSAGNMR